LGECHCRGTLPSRSEGKSDRHLGAPAPETVRARHRVRSDGSVRFRQRRKAASPSSFVRSRPLASDKSTRGTDESRETQIPILSELPAKVPLHEGIRRRWRRLGDPLDLHLDGHPPRDYGMPLGLGRDLQPVVLRILRRRGPVTREQRVGKEHFNTMHSRLPSVRATERGRFPASKVTSQTRPRRVAGAVARSMDDILRAIGEPARTSRKATSSSRSGGGHSGPSPACCIPSFSMISSSVTAVNATKIFSRSRPSSV
jgi:hypothetical protein